MTTQQTQSCILCTTKGGDLIVETPSWRVIRATDQTGYPLTYRVIWSAHRAELSDLSAQERNECMAAVAWVEQAMRHFLKPDKINLAALGNMVPHLHWHIIARYKWDNHFPTPIWGNPVRSDEDQWTQLFDEAAKLEQYLKDNVESFLKTGLFLIEK